MPQLATICYIDNGKELLMLHRNKKPNDVHEGKWIGVGGKLEQGETPQECAAREILEETGLKAGEDPQDEGKVGEREGEQAADCGRERHCGCDLRMDKDPGEQARRGRDRTSLKTGIHSP